MPLRKTNRRRVPSGGADGATLVIIVLSLSALFGMLVLVVDVGGLLYARRGMVNSSDAAALAAAQSCAKTSVVENPEAFADTYAAANSNGVVTAVTNIIDSSATCGSGSVGWVSVEYGKTLRLFLAPVLGLQRSNQVVTAATAHWGPAGSTHPIPIVVNEGALQGNCTIPEVAIGTRCYIWEDNDILSGSNFGFLDVGPQWNVPAGYPCNNVGGTPTIEDWVTGTTRIEPLDLNYPFATYVCARDGNRTPVWRTLETLVGRTFDFPINGVTPADGATVIANGSGNTEKYNIIGFARLMLIEVVAAKHSNPINCNNVPIPTPPPAFPIDLMALGRSTACPTMSPNAIFEPGSAKASPGNISLTVDNNGKVTGWSAKPDKISFNYTVAECGGIEAPNSSGHCLILEWRGAQIGGSNPGGGADFGLRAVALCDREVGSCLEPSS